MNGKYSRSMKIYYEIEENVTNKKLLQTCYLCYLFY